MGAHLGNLFLTGLTGGLSPFFGPNGGFSNGLLAAGTFGLSQLSQSAKAPPPPPVPALPGAANPATMANAQLQATANQGGNKAAGAALETVTNQGGEQGLKQVSTAQKSLLGG